MFGCSEGSKKRGSAQPGGYRGQHGLWTGLQKQANNPSLLPPCLCSPSGSNRSKVAVAPSGMSRNLRTPRGAGVLMRPIFPYRAVCRWPLFPHSNGGTYLRRGEEGEGVASTGVGGAKGRSHSLRGQQGAGLEQVAAQGRVPAGDAGRFRPALQVQAADHHVEDGRHGSQLDAIQHGGVLQGGHGGHAPPSRAG